MNIIVAGSRDFNNYTLVKETLTKQITDPKNTTILSGEARGPDKAGAKYAEDNKIACKKYPADWTKHGKSAGYIRNAEMLKEADKLIAFWDGKSKGTKNMIDISLKKKIPVVVITVGKDDNG